MLPFYHFTPLSQISSGGPSGGLAFETGLQDVKGRGYIIPVSSWHFILKKQEILGVVLQYCLFCALLD
ncbi:hypothetical protein ES703_100909 [subsurface metagenome]